MSTTALPPRPAVDVPGDLDALAVTTLRFLAVDAVEAARSGHPGLPLGAAPAAWVLWSRHLRHDPACPGWPDRDRFVLSAGHGSALLYALLHVFGYDLPLAELRRFRQLGSRTPGHPEAAQTPGVETTTGPLGQGLANAVGMALAERMLAARCNVDGHRVVGHRTWVLAGDGDLMEGVSHEAASLAGRLGLGRLVVVFDDNDVTIDGAARRSCADDAAARFAAYGWRTLRVEDGNDLHALDRAFADAAADEDRPTFVAVRTTIGYGASGVEGTPRAHGSPLGPHAVAAMRERFGWPAEPFHVPPAVRPAAAESVVANVQERAAWQRAYDAWAATHPRLAADFPLDRVPAPSDLTGLALQATATLHSTRTATRVASGRALATLARGYPALVGGSADLASSTNTAIPDGGDVGPGDFAGRTLHFGVREHGMAAVLNGIALHGGLRPFGSTFLVFADYLRPALRLSALMRLPVIHIFTHDSVHVGEDGPTHQPVEQLESLRLVPGLAVLRPADAAETVVAWDVAAARLDGPTALVLSRQPLPALDPVALDDLRTDGARFVRRAPATADVVLAASGSEVALSLLAAELLAARGVEADVVSVLWRERFADRLRAGRFRLPEVPAVWVEAGVTTGWRALGTPSDAFIGIDRFGASGPGPEVAASLGLTAQRVAQTALDAVRGRRRA